MSAAPLRTMGGLSRCLRLPARTFTTTARQLEAPAAAKTSSTTAAVQAEAERRGVVAQAPNRVDVWARSQRPRTEAMTGPRFEQTDFSLQPQPYSAMELIHQQPVQWTQSRIVACDGGGGPTGHPKVFINTDKPEITPCGYCGLPFANEHHREHLESLPQTSYPLK